MVLVACEGYHSPSAEFPPIVSAARVQAPMLVVLRIAMVVVEMTLLYQAEIGPSRPKEVVCPSSVGLRF